MGAEVEDLMHDMKEEEVEAKVPEEDHHYLKNTPNIETKPKAQQQRKPKKTSPSLTQKIRKLEIPSIRYDEGPLNNHNS